MKKLILFFIILIAIFVASAPYIDGYLFRDNYYQVFTWYQQKIQENNKDIQVSIDSYDMGWTKSTVNITIASKTAPVQGTYQMPPMVWKIKSIIHHGPLVYIDNKWQLGSAAIETAFYLPDFVKAFVLEKDQGFMQINTHVSLDGNTWVSHYAIPPDLFGANVWDGLSGDTVVEMKDGMPVKVNNTFTIGKVKLKAYPPFMPEINVAPMNVTADAIRQSPQSMNGNANFMTAGLSLKWQNGSVFNLNNFAGTSNCNISSNGLLDYNEKLTIDSMQLPPPIPVASITKFSLTGSLKNLNVAGLKNIGRANGFLSALTPTTSYDTAVSMMTNLGDFSTDLSLSLISLPQTENDIVNNVSAVMNARAAQPLIKKILIEYLVSRVVMLQSTQQGVMPQAPTDQTQHAETILNALLQQAVITQDKNDYIISLSKKGQDINLNGKTMKVDDLSALMINIGQLIDNTIAPPIQAPPATTTVPAPPFSPLPSPSPSPSPNIR